MLRELIMRAFRPERAEENEGHSVFYEEDAFFHSHYDLGLATSGTPDRGAKRRARFYNLVQAMEFTRSVAGGVAECGCWKGLSSYLMCQYLRRRDPAFRGEGITLIDSFEGLSEPTVEDVIDRDMVVKGLQRQGKPFKAAGAYAATVDHVSRVLADFPEIDFVKGWIPETLASLPEHKYRFVHIDLDLYEPILGALKYFYPRLARGGAIVCDDYGSLFWPGAKKAVEDFYSESGVTFMTNSSGQAMLFAI